jgi:hypothetical protein
MNSKTIEPARTKKALRSHDWRQLLIIPFGMNDTVQDAMRRVEEWILDEGVDWCGDDDDERQERPSYLILGCSQTRIQGPAIYVLLAGTSDNVDTSVELWNKDNHVKCLRVRFRAFGEHQVRRRRAMMTFLRGLIDTGCLRAARLYTKHLFSDRELRAQTLQL